jgi:hypothetical protein
MVDKNKEPVFFAFYDKCGILLASEKPLPSGWDILHTKKMPGKVYCSKHEGRNK